MVKLNTNHIQPVPATHATYLIDTFRDGCGQVTNSPTLTPCKTKDNTISYKSCWDTMYGNLSRKVLHAHEYKNIIVILQLSAKSVRGAQIVKAGNGSES